MAFKFKKSSADTADEKAETPPKPVKPRKTFRASGGAKFVLFIGDEGAILVHVKGNVVQSRKFVPDASEQSLAELKQIFEKDSRAPLMLAIDTMDQSYVQQTLPPVSSLSVNKLIKRRLEREFGVNDIKGSLLLGREKSGRKDWNFLMVSLERSPQLMVWMDFIEALPNNFGGIYLVAVEAEILIKHLERAMGVPKEGTGSEWKFIVSHNKVGGFRQVILRNGRIVFTRLAQPVGESSVEVIAGNIEQEVSSTIEYMKRMSFTPQAGLDVYIIASSSIKTLIDKTKFNANNLHVLTPFEVSEYLSIEGATQPSDQFGDVVLASMIGCSKKHVLTLAVPQFKQYDSYSSALRFQRLGAAFAALGVVGYGASIGLDIITHVDKLDALQKRQVIEQQSLNKLKEEIKNSEIDVETASDLIDLYKTLLSKRFTPVPFFEHMVPLTELPVWMKSFEWTQDAAAEDKMNLNISLEFPEAANDHKVFRVVAKKVLSDFKDRFKGYEVKYTSLPVNYLETDTMAIDLGGSNDTRDVSLSQGMPEAQISIKGALDLEKAIKEAAKMPPAAVPGAPPTPNVAP